MTTSTAQSDVDRVRDATDLLRLIGDHIALRPEGREHVGLCPFHDDRRPSLHVVTHKNQAFYKCFACGASGDCFRFVMDYHKMEFPEALQYLADRAGIKLRPRSAKPESTDAPRRSDLQKAVAFACDFFQRTLREPVAGAAAREVINRRGLSDAMVEQFLLGAAPDRFDGFLQRLGGKASALRTARAAGLLKERSGTAPGAPGAPGADLYDTFRNRLVFPICDEVGRPIAFGGRIIDPDDVPKYLNSPETMLFHKSKTLYGLHLAKQAIIQSNQAIVTEGYTDVIACHQGQITNVVGTLGTALTAEHGRLLSRLCDTVVLVFDGDEAGRKAADRAVEVFFAQPVDIRICVLPDGLDPDDLLKQDEGPQRFRDAVAGAIDALQYKLQRFEARLGEASGLSGRQKRLEQFLAELADLGFNGMQGVRKRLVITHLADLLHVSIADIERSLPQRRPRSAPRSAQPAAESAAEHAPAAPQPLLPDAAAGPDISRARRIAERDLLAILLFEPAAGTHQLLSDEDVLPAVTEIIRPVDFIDPPSRCLAELVFPKLREGATFTMPQLLGELGDETTRGLASRLFFDGRQRCAGDEAAAAGELRNACQTLRACIARETYERQMTTFRSAPRAPERATGESVIDLIRKRQEQGDLPGAISHGARS
ncbi:MAG: DNA primase [Planctomycetota bacterium]|nr:DNA primase [Planctomycetota bacterium]